MAKGKNQKLKLLYLLKILMEETDESHGLTRQELLDRLASHGVNADRKTLYTDFEELRTFGIDVLSERHGNDWFYYIGSREFELAELKLLVDTVQSAKFITERKSQALINKLESLVSRHEAGQLHRQVLISGRIKTMNESVYYNVDKIHAAISNVRRGGDERLPGGQKLHGRNPHRPFRQGYSYVPKIGRILYRPCQCSCQPPVSRLDHKPWQRYPYHRAGICRTNDAGGSKKTTETI